MGKLTKAKVLQAIKEHKFKEKDLVKRAELIEAINNATEDNIELVEHKAKVQVGYMEMDVTIEGSRTSGGDISVTTTTTYNHQIKSAKHVWLIDGDAKVAELYEILNGFSVNKDSCSTIDMGSKFYGQYVYRAGNESSATSLIGINYGKEALRRLNLTYRSSHVNAYEFVPETDPYEVSYWDIYFTYTTSKGKQKRINVGKVLIGETLNDHLIELEFPFEKQANTQLIGNIVKYGLIGIALIALIVWLILR